jgi:hypothetical protein
MKAKSRKQPRNSAVAKSGQFGLSRPFYLIKSMTLILSAFYNDFVIQVSDRRLTHPDGSLYDDESNKAILLENRIAIGYSGLAFINGQKTDDWIAQTLINIQAKSQSQDIAYLMTELSLEATRVFEKIQLGKSIKKLAIVGVGWMFLQEDNGLASPIFLSLSNAQTNRFEWLGEAEDKFVLHPLLGRSENQGFFILTTGQTIPSLDFKRLGRQIKRCFEHNTGPEPVVRLLADAIQKRSTQENTVGKTLMAVCIPKEAIFSPLLTNLAPIASTTMKKNPSFRYISPSRDYIQFSPTTIAKGVGLKFQAERTNETGSDGIFTLERILPK